MNPLIAASLLSGLASNVGSFVSTAAANAQNVRLAEEQRAWNLRMFHLQNQYNHPSAQMQRLKDAGLNPNLVYDRGNVNVPSAVVSSSSAAQVSPYQFSFDPSMFVSMKQLELDERRLNLEEKMNLITRRKIEEETRTEQYKQENIQSDTVLKEANTNLQTQLHDFNSVMNQLSVNHSKLDYLQKQVLYPVQHINQQLQNEKLRAEISTEDVLREAKHILFKSQASNNFAQANFTNEQKEFLEAVKDFRVASEKWASKSAQSKAYLDSRLSYLESLKERDGVDALRVLLSMLKEIVTALSPFNK